MSSEENERNQDAGQPPDDQQPIVGRLVGENSSLDESNPAASAAAIDGDDFGLGEKSGETSSEPEESTEIAEHLDDPPIRVGSPFAVDPTRIAGTVIQRRRAKPEDFYDVGPLRYTAMGAVAAATLVLGFAAVAAWWFPGGGTIIAALGCALSIFGLYSQRRLAAGGCLLLHLLLFMISYSRAIDV